MRLFKNLYLFGFLSARKKSCFLKDEKWSKLCLEKVSNSGKVKSNSNTMYNLINPGDSILAECILTHHENNLVVWEKQQTYLDFIKKLKLRYPDRFSCHRRSFNVDFLYTLIKSLKTGCDKCVLLSHVTELNVFIMQFLKFSLLKERYSLDVPLESFHFFDQNECKYLKNPEIWWSSDIGIRIPMYGLFFKHEVLLEVPSEAFNKKIFVKLKRKNNKIEEKSMFFTRLTLSDKIAILSDEEKFEAYKLAKMLKHLNRKRCSRIIPLLDDLCNGIGLTLIEETDLNMLDLVKDVPLNKWFQIYNIMSSHPNYDFSSMKQIILND